MRLLSPEISQHNAFGYLGGMENDHTLRTRSENGRNCSMQSSQMLRLPRKVNSTIHKTTGCNELRESVESQDKKAKTILLKIKDLSLHDRVSQALEEWDVPPLEPPMPLALMKAAREELRQLLVLNPPLVVKARRRWKCVGNLRAFSLARVIFIEEDEILCIELNEAPGDIERRLLLELVMQPALLGVRRQDVGLLARVAACADLKGEILPLGRHRDAVSYVASLYRLERRQLKDSERSKDVGPDSQTEKGAGD